MSRSPSRQELATSDGYAFFVSHAGVSFVDTADEREMRRTRQVPESDLRTPLLDWISEEGSGWPAPTLANRVYAAARLSRAAAAVGSDQVTGAWALLLERTRRMLSEGTARTYASVLMDFFDWALFKGIITPYEMRIIEDRGKLEYKGFSLRHRRRRAKEYTLSADIYRRFFTAIRMELDFLRRHKTQNGDPHHLAAVALFPLLMALDQGLRSTELNQMNWGDVEARPEKLFVHGRNKPRGWLPISPHALKAWGMARRWMQRFRCEEQIEPGEPALVYLSPGDGEIRRLRATQMNVFLRMYFYPKYMETIGGDGLPILYETDSKTGNPQRLSLGFQHLRHLAITHLARSERNPQVLQQFARHRYLSTTVTNYVTLTPEDRRRTIAEHLGPLSEQVRMRVEGAVATEEELARAVEMGAILPQGGACGEALSGEYGCLRATDCRLCAHFLIDLRRRDFFVESAERKEREAQAARENRGMARDSENLLQLAAIDRAIVQIIDEHGGPNPCPSR